MGLSENFYNTAWKDWRGMIDHSPAPNHRRRLIKNLLKHKKFVSIADIGCGNGALINYLNVYFPYSHFSGFDFSSEIINVNEKTYPQWKWKQFDLGKDIFSEKFDIMICSEVIEHLENWQNALWKIINAANKMCIITVPAGKIFKIDKEVGHIRHFNKEIISRELGNNRSIDFKIFYWGFPFHMLYKNIINLFPRSMYNSFMKDKYSVKERLISKFINVLFYLNIRSCFRSNQLFIIITKV